MMHNTKPPDGFGIVYLLTSPSGKSYVGQTRYSLNSRFWRHCTSSKGYLMRAAILKYGKENISKAVLRVCTLSDIDDVEQFYITQYNTLAPNGYNLKGGGLSGSRTMSQATREKFSLCKIGLKKSAETRLRMSLSQIGRHRVYTAATKKRMSDVQKGKIHSEETKLKMSVSHKGHPVSDETRRKLSIAKMGRAVSPETLKKMSLVNLGKKLSDETKAKMKASQQARRMREQSQLPSASAVEAVYQRVYATQGKESA